MPCRTCAGLECDARAADLRRTRRLEQRIDPHIAGEILGWPPVGGLRAVSLDGGHCMLSLGIGCTKCRGTSSITSNAYQAYAIGASAPGPCQISSTLAMVWSARARGGTLKFWRSCSTVRGPLIAAVTTGLCSMLRRLLESACFGRGVCGFGPLACCGVVRSARAQHDIMTQSEEGIAKRSCNLAAT